MKPILIGTSVHSAFDTRPPEIRTSDPLLQQHIPMPWFRAHCFAELGYEEQTDSRTWTQSVAIPHAALDRHALITGASGSGKSRLLERLLVEQLCTGASAVVIDPKGETIQHMISHARRIGLAPKHVILFSPSRNNGVPGWNPFLVDLPVAQVVGDVVSVIERSSSSTGPRMRDLLYNITTIAVTFRLSIYEITKLLTHDDYRERLARKQPDHASYAFAEALEYVQRELNGWSRAERLSAIQPVLNKIRSLVQIDYLRALLCAKENTINLARLWQDQLLILVHLDRTALGDEGARLLAGLLSSLLFRTALRQRGGNCHVCLAIDELATVESFVEQTITDILAQARSQRLRLICACQFMAQISTELQAAVLGNTAIQATLRVSPVDARLIGTWLAAGHPVTPREVVAALGKPDRTTGDHPEASWRHAILNAAGSPLRLTQNAWDALLQRPDYLTDPVRALRILAASAGVERLYVRDACSREPSELGRYTEGVHPRAVSLSGPVPLGITIRFPRPKLTVTDKVTEADAARRFAGIIQDLPTQHAVLHVAGTPSHVVRIADVEIPTPSNVDRTFIHQSEQANCQSQQAIEQTLAGRRSEIERVASGRADEMPGDCDDNSIW